MPGCNVGKLYVVFEEEEGDEEEVKVGTVGGQEYHRRALHTATQLGTETEREREREIHRLPSLTISYSTQ